MDGLTSGRHEGLDVGEVVEGGLDGEVLEEGEEVGEAELGAGGEHLGVRRWMEYCEDVLDAQVVRVGLLALLVVVLHVRRVPGLHPLPHARLLEVERIRFRHY